MNKIPEVRKNIDKMSGYVPGEQPKDMEYVKLNTNESPFPPSPKAVEKAKKWQKVCSFIPTRKYVTLLT